MPIYLVPSVYLKLVTFKELNDVKPLMKLVQIRIYPVSEADFLLFQIVRDANLTGFSCKRGPNVEVAEDGSTNSANFK